MTVLTPIEFSEDQLAVLSKYLTEAAIEELARLCTAGTASVPPPVKLEEIREWLTKVAGAAETFSECFKDAKTMRMGRAMLLGDVAEVEAGGLSSIGLIETLVDVMNAEDSTNSMDLIAKAARARLLALEKMKQFPRRGYAFQVSIIAPFLEGQGIKIQPGRGPCRAILDVCFTAMGIVRIPEGETDPDKFVPVKSQAAIVGYLKRLRTGGENGDQ